MEYVSLLRSLLDAPEDTSWKGLVQASIKGGLDEKSVSRMAAFGRTSDEVDDSAVRRARRCSMGDVMSWYRNLAYRRQLCASCWL
jgi:hypothetical protein